MSDRDKNVAKILSNQKEMIETYGKPISKSSIGDFTDFVLPLIRCAYPKLPFQIMEYSMEELIDMTKDGSCIIDTTISSTPINISLVPIKVDPSNIEEEIKKAEEAYDNLDAELKPTKLWAMDIDKQVKILADKWADPESDLTGSLFYFEHERKQDEKEND